MQSYTYIRRFNELGIAEVPLVGGKNASPGKMYRALSGQGVKVPNGYTTTAQACRDFLQHNDLDTRIREAGKYIGICSQAASDFPEITHWLVEQGIESISLNPDSVLKMTQVVLDIEREKQREPALADCMWNKWGQIHSCLTAG